MVVVMCLLSSLVDKNDAAVVVAVVASGAEDEDMHSEDMEADDEADDECRLLRPQLPLSLLLLLLLLLLVSLLLLVELDTVELTLTEAWSMLAVACISLLLLSMETGSIAARRGCVR